jgi:hypothetical protein
MIDCAEPPGDAMPARHAPRLLLAAALSAAGAARADWTGEPLIDRMTDFQGWVASTVGKDFDAPEAEPTLWVQCRNGRTDVSVFGIHPLAVVNVRGATPVMVRFGDARPELLSWVISSDGYGAFAAEPIAFARRLATTDAERLLIRLTPTNRRPFDMEFSLDGARAEVETAAARCGWPLDPPPQDPPVATAAPQSSAPPAAEDPDDDDASPASVSETALRALSNGVRRHFSPVPGLEDEAVTIEVALAADGSLIGPPSIVAPAGRLDPAHQSLRMAATMALMRAQQDGTFASFAGLAGPRRLRMTFAADGAVGAP